MRYLSVTINCEAATRYALRMSDNRDGTETNILKIFGLLDRDAPNQCMPPLSYRPSEESR